jgi:hypothetical protein
MNVAEAAAAVLAREGVGVLLAYPLNPLIESPRAGKWVCVLHAGWAGHGELFNHHSAQCPATS